MDFWEFLARSEWPVVVGGTIVMFRRQIRRLLNHVHSKKVNVMGNEVELEPDRTKAQRLSGDLTSSSEMTASLTAIEAPNTFVTSDVPQHYSLSRPGFIQGVWVNSAWIGLMGI